MSKKTKNALMVIILIITAILFMHSLNASRDVSLENQKLIREFLERQKVNKNAIIKTQELILQKCQ